MASLPPVCGITTASLWHHYRQSVASLPPVCGITTESLWHHYRQSVASLPPVCGITTASLWHHYRQSVASLLTVCGITTASLWHHYRQSVANCAKVAAPLHALTGKEDVKGRKATKVLDWSEETAAAFTSLKQAPCSTSVLTYPCRDYTVYVSGVDICGVLQR